MSQPSMTDGPPIVQQERRRALHADYYSNEDIFAQEKEKLFFKAWQYACHASELAEPGAFVAP